MASLILLTLLVSQTLTHLQTDIKTIRKLSNAILADHSSAAALAEARLLVAEGYRPGDTEFAAEALLQPVQMHFASIVTAPKSNPRLIALVLR